MRVTHEDHVDAGDLAGHRGRSVLHRHARGRRVVAAPLQPIVRGDDDDVRAPRLQIGYHGTHTADDLPEVELARHLVMIPEEYTGRSHRSDADLQRSSTDLALDHR